MILVQLVQELIAIGEAILGHFVTGTAGTASLLPDYEWTITGASSFNISTKGNYLAGAVADIVTYGAILVDWIVQSLLNTTVNAYNGTAP
jgi:hypothetical protein